MGERCHGLAVHWTPHDKLWAKVLVGSLYCVSGIERHSTLTVPLFTQDHKKMPVNF